METRRYILAIGLSMLVLVVYLHFFAPKPVEQPAPQRVQTAAPEQQETRQQGAEAPAPKPAAVAKAIAVAAKGRDIVIETDVVRAVVNTAGGVITKWELKDYREADKEEVGFMVTVRKLFGGAKKEDKPKRPLGNVELFTRYDGVKPEDIVAPLTVTPVEKELRNLAAVEFKPSAESIRLDKDRKSQTLVLTYKGPAGIAIEKKLTFYHDQYKVDVEVGTAGPVQMKKGRAGVRIEAVVPEARLDDARDALFRHSTTAGVRLWRAERTVLERRQIEVELAPGVVVSAKALTLPGGGVRVKPEFDDVIAAAAALGRLPLDVARASQRGAEDRIAKGKERE